MANIKDEEAKRNRRAAIMELLLTVAGLIYCAVRIYLLKG